ncbi:hypothetical protein PF005_g8410 [Phytophthora fragariae]|uniref:Uncharacterized protein n=1 Tax=Phytophthora fragariae TaxID=53985 RepID=A0A6A4DP49_9STRA|nr:hypothetical protein PF003_g29078 [Phytophthora fragariae]KAE9015156.1 hypothetical protein PF011_g7751 [Phytophthora fragariae]KAE9116030.1 hypothetical protein PF007_g9815 [Phytophthora fragariae]KAE9218089.1 hypothetical protein PF005_g8410 [Phytophthora fragariae]KAE9239912.1 hypothetical protein PF002_g10029 [Phytophthora fragariae]
MARSKEQWKAQKRAQHTQTKSNSFFQMKTPHPPSGRPQAPPATSAIFQLGRPTSAAAAAAVRPVVLKSDPIQTPSRSVNASGRAVACIDLTLDDDDEEEDEPMGTRGHSLHSAASRATNAPPAITVTAPPATATTVTATPSSAAVKLGMLDGPGTGPTAVTVSLQQIELASEMMVPLVEDVESDVDEEWPLVPPPENEQYSASKTEEDVTAALDVIRKTIPFAQDEEGRYRTEKSVPTQTPTPPLSGDDDDEMEADVDEELPSQAPKDGNDSSGSPTTADRIVRVENLEDGEIFEEGAAPKQAIEVQRAIMLEMQADAHPVDPMEIRPHLRNKKQKKRGKKKTKRKLEAMQMVDAPPGEMPSDFERVTRQRLFREAPPPGPFTYAMMRNGSRGEPMNVRPVFQDPPPASFHPGGMYIGAPHLPIRPPLPQSSAPSMPPPPLYEDSRILRVNRQGSMEMLDNASQMSVHAMFSDPPRHGGFKYRSVSISPPRLVPSEPSHLLQRSVSDTSRLPPLPAPGRDSPSNPAANEERDGPDDFDLDSLRAAALRSKTKRPAKNPTPTIQKAIESLSTSSSSPSSPLPEQKQSEPTSPEINKLRLEILRSMQRNRKRTANKVTSKTLVSTPPTAEMTANEQPEQSTCETGMDGKEVETVGVNKPSAAETGISTANKLASATLEKASGITQPECVTNDGSSCETDKSTIISELNESSNKGRASPAEYTKAPTDVPVTTPEFRPLTACSQSLVIRVNPEDFSPRKGGNDERTEKAPAPSSLHDAIKEMRRQIAEREKAQTNRLLESTAAKLSRSSSAQGSSSSLVSSSPFSLDTPSPEDKTSVAVCRQSGATAALPVIESPAAKTSKESLTATAPERSAINGPEIQRSTNGDAEQAKETKENVNKQRLLPETQLPAETVAEKELSPGPEEPRDPALEPEKRNNTSADISTLTISDGARGTTSCEKSTTKKPACATPATPGSNDALDFGAIRAEYEQCVAECDEADAQIARLSNEMALLEKQLQPVGPTVGGS